MKRLEVSIFYVLRPITIYSWLVNFVPVFAVVILILLFWFDSRSSKQKIVPICSVCRFGRHVAADYYICKKGIRPENNKCEGFKYNNLEDLALLIYVTILAILYVMLIEGVI